jgi:hypothetical protein
MSKIVGITAALCLLAVVLGVALAFPPSLAPPGNKTREWIETWRCEVFSWSEINGTYHVRCLHNEAEHYFMVDKSNVIRHSTENVYRQFYHLQTDKYGTTSIVYISEELTLQG